MPIVSIARRPEYDNIYSLNHVFDHLLPDEVGSALEKKNGSSDTSLTKGFGWSPRCNVYEGEKEFTFHCELPGIKKEDVHVDIKDDILTISGKSEQTSTTENRTARISERRFGQFQRSFTLGRDVNKEAVEAKFENGVLEVHVPKRVEKASTTHKIDIK